MIVPQDLGARYEHNDLRHGNRYNKNTGNLYSDYVNIIEKYDWLVFENTVKTIKEIFKKTLDDIFQDDILPKN